MLPLSLIDLLRTALEHINLSMVEREGLAQKVYSYGIILQEIATRSKTFLDGPMRPRGKLNVVTTPFMWADLSSGRWLGGLGRQASRNSFSGVFKRSCFPTWPNILYPLSDQTIPRNRVGWRKHFEKDLVKIPSITSEMVLYIRWIATIEIFFRKIVPCRW